MFASLESVEDQLLRPPTHSWQVGAEEPNQGYCLWAISPPGGLLHKAIGFPHDVMAGFQKQCSKRQNIEAAKTRAQTFAVLSCVS